MAKLPLHNPCSTEMACQINPSVSSAYRPAWPRCSLLMSLLPSQHATSSFHQQNTVTACSAHSRNSTNMSISDSLDLLDLDSANATDAEELKRAYYHRMREIHPDVNPDLDTTETAARVNAAYAALLKELGKSASGVVVTADACDVCDGPVDRFFVNPFACGTDPFLWRELHDAVCTELDWVTGASKEAAAGAPGAYAEVNDLQVEEALLSVGLRAVPGAVVWLTANQRAAIQELMNEMEQSLSFDLTEWVLVDSLLRAEKANRRGWQS